MCLHAVVVALFACYASSDPEPITVSRENLVPAIIGLSLTGVPFLFISPVICVTMLLRGLIKDSKYFWFALAEFLLWIIHVSFMLPTVH